MGKRKRVSKLANIQSGVKAPPNKSAISLMDRLNFSSDDGPQIPIRSLFSEDYQFPPAESMTEAQLTEKLDQISDTLYGHNIVFEFWADVPDKLVYNYLVNKVIAEETIAEKKIDGCLTHLTGCDGACDICFQKGYCDTD
jgi:hypothetical protein